LQPPGPLHACTLTLVLRIIAALLAFSAAAFGQIPTVTAVDGTNYLPAGLSSVVNNASSASPRPTSPGAMANAFANHLGTTTDQLSALFLSTSSEGVQVTFNSAAAPLFHLMASTSQQQIDFREAVQIK
jgi:hypothetical protein